MTSIVLPTLAVAASWFLFGVVLLGCGFAVRLGLQRLFAPGGGEQVRCADLWIGLAAVEAYLLVWNEVAAVTWASWLAPAVAALAGIVLAGRRLRGTALRRPSPWVIAPVAVAALVLANQALGTAGDYDFGLYHLGLISYAEHYATIPGLANLHARFGAGDGHLLFVAFLDHGPWAGAGPHLGDGLLAALLAVELGSRFAFGLPAGGLASFANRLALLLVPASVTIAAARPSHRISSPNLDFAAFVLVLVGMLYLAEAVERRFPPVAVIASTGALATAAVTRPLYWLCAAASLGIALVAAARSEGSGARRAIRAAGLGGLLPALLFLGWTARQSVLSGYPLFPLTSIRLPVDWRVPLALVDAQNRADHAWARLPGVPADVVLASWHWLTLWISHEASSPDVVVPLLLLACLAPALALGPRPDPERRRRAGPMLVVVLPCLATLVAWFLIAPDPRFAWAPIWLVPLALVAWALPTRLGRPSPWLLAAAAIAAAALARLGRAGSARWPDVVAVAASLILVAVLLALHKRPAGIALAVTGTAILAGLFIVADTTLFVSRSPALIRATPGNPLGTASTPVPTLVPIKTTSGLIVYRPVVADQCWHALLCLPVLTEPDLTMRGRSIGDGFRPSPPHIKPRLNLATSPSG